MNFLIPDKKPTDNDIVKALEDAIKIGDAPIGKYWGCMISKLTAKEALDLINRQKAEIEMDDVEIKELRIALQGYLDDLTKERNLYKKSIEELNQANAEIERLNKIAEQRKKAYFSKVAECIEIRKTAKAEAYREFAERVKKKLYIADNNWHPVVCEEEIDEALKELVGDDDG